MATPKSPFKIYRNFLSPKFCEDVVDDLGFYTPDVDAEGRPIKMYRHHEPSSMLIYSRIKQIIPDVEEYYSVEHRGTEDITFEYIATGVKPEPICENSSYIRKKWTRIRDRDLTGLLFLSDYQEEVPFDRDYEVYGGKLEFPQHGFSFEPERGTLVVYPSGPHFINAFSEVFAGDLFVARFHFGTELPFLYNPAEFPGDYTSWFRDLL